MSYETPGIDTLTNTYDGPVVFTFPLAKQGDVAHFVASEKYRIQAGNYVAPALDATRVFGATTAYLVGDIEPQQVEAGLVEFTRQWATIPATRTRSLGSFPYQYPGIAAASLSSTQTITAVSFGSVFSTVTIVGHGYVNNEYVLVSINYTSNAVAKFFTSLCRIFNVTANTFNVYFPANVAPLVFSNGTARTFTPKRSPTVEVTTGIVTFEYALPGVTSGVPTAASYVSRDTFRVVQDSDNSVTTTLTGAPTPTRPTLLSYQDMVRNQNLLVAESTVEEYMGNILVRRTVLVPAV